MRAHRFLIAAFSIAFSIIPLFSAAQVLGADSASLTLTPPNPGPNQTVSAKLDTYLTDLGRAQISWLINGQTVESGVGLKNFSFKTGPIGSVTSLSVIAITTEGYPLSKNLTIRPAAVALVYEANSYTPPFYKGRAYFPYGGSARVIATASFVDENGEAIPSSALFYKWKDGDKILDDSSGFGKNILFYKNSNLIPKTADISVEVASADNSLVAKGLLTIDPVSPEVVLYNNNPQYGVLYNKALPDSYTLSSQEMGITAVPYFFGAASADDIGLKYEWNLNGNPISSGGSNIILRRPASSGGVSSLSLQVSNTIDYFQFASANLSLIFSALSNN